MMVETKSDIALWKQFETLFLDGFMKGFHSFNPKLLPYGSFHDNPPKQRPSMLWRADLSKASSFDSVIDEIEKLATDHQGTAGFAISPSWLGTVEDFKKNLHSRNYKPGFFHWYTRSLSRINPAVSQVESSVIIETTANIEDFCDVMSKAFSPDSAAIFKKGAAANINDTRRKFFLARDLASKKYIGCAGLFIDGSFAYLHDLGVKPEARGHKIAQSLVNARLKAAQELGALQVITSVADANLASRRVQEKAGYHILATTEYWTRS